MTVLAPVSVRSNAHRIYLALRENLIRCVYAPGQKLRIADLADEFGVSAGAVREALSRLTAEHLVEARDQQGFRAAAISIDDLMDLTAARIELERLVLTRSIAAGDAAWAADLERAHDLLVRTPNGPVSEGASAHGRFHASLVAACPNHTMLRLRATLYEASERYRHFALQHRVTRRDVDAEHAAMTAAALNRDAETASRLMAQHIQATADHVRLALASLAPSA